MPLVLRTKDGIAAGRAVANAPVANPSMPIRSQLRDQAGESRPVANRRRQAARFGTFDRLSRAQPSQR
jgi:hypothetical protein